MLDNLRLLRICCNNSLRQTVETTHTSTKKFVCKQLSTAEWLC